MKTWLTTNFNIDLPIIMAPMFLVSNNQMIKAAANSGIMGCIPALNWKTPEEFEKGIKDLKENCKGPFGINLIANKSNIYLEEQIQICQRNPPNFVITSLGSPQRIIEDLKPHGVKVLCDVTDIQYAKKVESLGADALIAVNNGAGGHAGTLPPSLLIPMLKKATNLPLINAGAVATGEGLLSILALGAEGASIGSPFIACKESQVSREYKEAIVHYGAEDIAMSSKISGTPCSVIKTPYVKKQGLKQNVLEKFLNKNKKIKKFAKMLTYYKGTKQLAKAAFSATYKTVWVAGPTIEFVRAQEEIATIIHRLKEEYNEALTQIEKKL